MAPEKPPDPVAVAIETAGILERLGIAYLAAGSLASSAHGEPRSTLGIDIVADVRADHVPEILRSFGTDYYVDEDAIREALRSGSSFNLVHLSTAVKVDIFVAGDDPFDAERLARRQRLVMWPDPPREVYVDRAEYIVLRKLEWYRRGGEVSDRQWRDSVGVLRLQGDRLDTALLEHWAGRLGVTDLLQRARSEARG
jgi:hypothetical protein